MPVKEGDRPNFSKCFVGANNTGKSTLALHIAKVWRKANPNQLVVSFDPQHNFRGVTDYFIDIEDKDWALKCGKLKNCLLILDDYRMINEPNQPVKGLKRLLYERTFNNVDIIHICHAPSEILNVFAHYTTHYYIYYTEARDDEFKNKIPNYSLVKAASKRVNDYVSLVGTDNYAKLYPNFPYMFIDCKSRKLKAINMHNDLGKIPLNNVSRSDKILLSKIKNGTYQGNQTSSYKSGTASGSNRKNNNFIDYKKLK